MAQTDSYIIRKHLTISAICTIFVTYPNIMWIPWNLARLMPGEDTGFWGFFIFRIVYFFMLIYSQLRFNFEKLNHGNFVRRFMRNFLFTLVGCSVFVALSYGLPYLGIQTGYVGNILLFQFFVVCLLCSFIGYIAHLDSEQRRKEQEIERLKIENLQSRYNALSNQINPHFFFNSLNGISSLVRRGDNDSTLEYVDRLSHIFRYILQSDREQLVPLSKELKFVEAFSHVMQVRFGGKLNFNITIDESHTNKLIPVLSLLPLLENISVHNRIDSSHLMNVSISVNDSAEVVVENPIYPKISSAVSNGTGLNNLDNRFLLLVGKHIHVTSTPTSFIVNLPLTDSAK